MSIQDEHALYTSLWHLNKEHWMKSLTERIIKGGHKEESQIKSYNIQKYDDPEMTRIIFKSPRKHCIHAVVNKQDKSAVLSSLEYDPECTSPAEMRRGQDTRDMLDYAFKLMKDAGATEVALTDKSKVMCGGRLVKLSELYFFKYGMTWYEKYFGFQPEREDHQEMYKEMKLRRKELYDEKVLAKTPCEYFDEKKIDEMFEEIGIPGRKFHNFAWVKKL